jgi:hypothetical protein
LKQNALAGLKSLRLINTQITDAGLVHLKGLTNAAERGRRDRETTSICSVPRHSGFWLQK